MTDHQERLERARTAANEHYMGGPSEIANAAIKAYLGDDTVYVLTFGHDPHTGDNDDPRYVPLNPKEQP